jgi:hypothetical protein
MRQCCGRTILGTCSKQNRLHCILYVFQLLLFYHRFVYLCSFKGFLPDGGGGTDEKTEKRFSPLVIRGIIGYDAFNKLFHSFGRRGASWLVFLAFPSFLKRETIVVQVWVMIKCA